jgi:hypothetical protein
LDNRFAVAHVVYACVVSGGHSDEDSRVVNHGQVAQDLFKEYLVDFRGAAGFFDNAREFDRAGRALGPFAGTEAEVLFFEEVAWAGFLRVADAVAQANGTGHYSFSFFHVFHRDILTKKFNALL